MDGDIEMVLIIGWGRDGELTMAIRPGVSMPTATLMLEEIHKRCQTSLTFKKRSLIETAHTVPPIPPDLRKG